MARSDWSILITLSKCCHLIDYTPKVRLTGNVGVSKMYSLSQELLLTIKRYFRQTLLTIVPFSHGVREKTWSRISYEEASHQATTKSSRNIF